MGKNDLIVYELALSLTSFGYEETTVYYHLKMQFGIHLVLSYVNMFHQNV